MSGNKRSALSRTETVAIDVDELEMSPPRKKQRTAKPKREKIAYSTTTVLRSLDGEGEASEAPLMSSLRSASFHTRKVLQQQRQREQKKQTPEILVRLLCLSSCINCIH